MKINNVTMITDKTQMHGGVPVVQLAAIKRCMHGPVRGTVALLHHVPCICACSASRPVFGFFFNRQIFPRQLCKHYRYAAHILRTRVLETRPFGTWRAKKVYDSLVESLVQLISQIGF